MLKVPREGKWQYDRGFLRCVAPVHSLCLIISACYNVHDATSMTESRIKVWIQKVGSKEAAAPPKLCTLQPTNEAVQCCIWRCALQQQLDFDPTEYGWVKNEVSKSLQSVTLPAATLLAPDYILRLITCSYSSESPCRSKGCGCNRGRSPCTIFCNCQGNTARSNQQTRATDNKQGHD